MLSPKNLNRIITYVYLKDSNVNFSILSKIIHLILDIQCFRPAITRKLIEGLLTLN